jgi:hypothetical protein
MFSVVFNLKMCLKWQNSEWDWGENMFDYHSKLAAFSPRVMMFFDCYYTRPPNTPDSVFAYQYPGMPEMVHFCKLA